ncbi:molybdenum cofactor cytidylyltransferase [Scopulibacillus darangshiensis]|uniref:Molybdenum cofactor cytidylyltransferase n=1 Tax=Scopulibacillus darangshiensis TaxID=442528 RepID=A0A4V2SNL2_9BACL|nr:nucleotidyltransferase family protein [Scopulibacillus darangshiensis]TCP31576.1 molybdenum cofactor cytidylyltransferase [Scopulibacillus darangshiensis]
MHDYGVAGILLAAGKSTRMGKNKLALPFKELTIGSHSFQSAARSRLQHLFVVTKKADSLNWLIPCQPRVNSVPWSQKTCPDAVKGQSYSIKCGIKAAMDSRSEAVIIMLADQPCVTIALINSLILTFEWEKQLGNDILYVATKHNGVIQPPILFTTRAYPELLKLEGDKGARYLLKHKMFDRGVIMNWDDPMCFFDVDTEVQYRILISR